MLLPVENRFHQRVQRLQFAIKEMKLYRDMARCYATFRNIITAHARKRLFRSFRLKIWPCHSLRRPWFTITRQYIFYRRTFSQWFCDLFSAPAQK